MVEKKSLYNVLVVLFSTFGSFTFGYCMSALANALSKPSFYEYFGLDQTGPGADRTNAIIGALNALTYVGGFFGSFLLPTCADRWGRRWALAIGCVFVIVGGVLQAGSVAVAMLCVSRFITGVGVGVLLSGVPLFQAEISPPHSRGLMVGLHGTFLGFGSSVAQWVGVAFFHIDGQVTWRVPLGIQSIFPLILLCGIAILPESPRWLYKNGRSDQALRTLIRLHKDPQDPTDEFARKEFDIMIRQINFEEEQHMSVLQMFKIPSMRKRLIIGFLTMAGGQMTGLLVILNYGYTIYSTLGFSPFMIGVMIGIWSVINGFGNLAGAVITDRVGRVRLMVVGYIGVVICLICESVLIALYAGTDNHGGNSAAVFFIFLILIFYTAGIEGASFTYTAEIFPTPVRATGVAFSMTGLFIFAIIFQASAATAFAGIQWRFYMVFAALSTAMAFAIAFFWPETAGYNLEQLGNAFGDQVASEKSLHEGEQEKSPGTDAKVTEIA